MKVTGVEIQFATQRVNKKLKTLNKKFQHGIKSFEDGPKEDIIAISAEIEKNELLIAENQNVLTHYNLKNHLDFEGKNVTLSEAIRIIGALDRTEVRWRGTIEEHDRYGSHEQRSNDTKYREHVLTFDQRAAEQEKAQERAAKIRKAVQLANARSIDLDLDVSEELNNLLSAS